MEIETMPFEKAKAGSRGGTSNQPLISLRKSGGIGINQAAFEEFFDDAEHVEIFVDEEENQLGLKPLDEESDDSYTLSKSESGASVMPMSVMNRYQLTPDITTRYVPSKEKINGSTELVVVDLDEEYDTYGKPKSEEEDE